MLVILSFRKQEDYDKLRDFSWVTKSVPGNTGLHIVRLFLKQQKFDLYARLVDPHICAA